MADIELVIKIPEEIYEASQILDVKYEDTVQIPLEVIANGTPLPKCHGKLIDADALKLTRHDIHVEEINYLHRCVSIENIDNEPTIIEADKAESEE